jgi:hypothetical protein
MLAIALWQDFIGSVSDILGGKSCSEMTIILIPILLPLLFLNFWILNGRRDSFVHLIASMPAWRQRVLNALAAGVALFVIVFFFRSAPPIPQSGT